MGHRQRVGRANGADGGVDGRRLHYARDFDTSIEDLRHLRRAIAARDLPKPEGATRVHDRRENDRQYIEEFRRRPIGVHSPGLQRVLNIMRHDPSGWQIILVCKRPFAKWVLGLMPPRRSEPIQFEAGPIFATREEAEWEVFRRRWRVHTGQDITTPFAG